MTRNRIDQMFDRCREENRAALILYLTSGFPDADTTRRLLPVLAQAGCDLLELGVPFSDPIADGPVIQQASTVALEAGMTTRETFQIAKEFRQTSEMPVILFGAFNPFLRMGLDECTAAAAAAGIDGFLAADLPVEEAQTMRAACDAHNLHLVSLIAPTSGDDRVRQIAELSSGFLYCIAVKGITGARESTASDMAPYLERIKRQTNLPRALGFGISTPEHVAQAAAHAEGVVIGSALIKLIHRCKDEGLDLEKTVGDYVRSLAAATKRK